MSAPGWLRPLLVSLSEVVVLRRALADVCDERDLLQARLDAAEDVLERDAPQPVAPPARAAAIRRASARPRRPGCRHPRKWGYDLDDPEQRRLAERMLGDGKELYTHCPCRLAHIGHIPGPRLPLQLTERPDEIPAIRWARERATVDLYTATGELYATGRAIAWHGDPTVVVELPDGRHKSWRTDLAREHPPD